MPPTRSTAARPDGEMLRRLYVDDGLGCPEIGRRFGRDPKTVLWWLREAGIPTRPRGADTRQHFKPGRLNGFAGRRHSKESRQKIREATIARGGVPYLRGGKHWLSDAAPEDNPRWKGGGTAERQDFYRSKEWKAACRLVWARADAKCERCSRDHRDRDRETEREFRVHHIVSFAFKELRAEPSNLALLCWPCHRFVHSKENVGREFLRDVPADEKEAA